MGIVSRIRGWWSSLSAADDAEWDEEDEDREETAKAIPARAARPLESLICTPRDYKDARYAVQSLKEGKIVIVRLMEVDEALGQRILDFMSGAVYLLHGSMQFFGGVLICTPDTVRLEQGDYQFNVVSMPVFRRVGS